LKLDAVLEQQLQSWSPAARGRGLKRQLVLKFQQQYCRPPRAGVD